MYTLIKIPHPLPACPLLYFTPLPANYISHTPLPKGSANRKPRRELETKVKGEAGVFLLPSPSPFSPLSFAAKSLHSFLAWALLS